MRRPIYLPVLFAFTNALSLPPATGPYNVGSKAYLLNHTTIDDPVDPSGTGTSLLVTLYYPTRDPAPTQKYLSDQVTDWYEKYCEDSYGVPITWNNITASIAFNASAMRPLPSRKLPTLLFGPPAAGPPSQLFYTLFSDLASHGYTIVTVDHPYEAPILPLPNGTALLGLPPDLGNVDLERLYEVRLADNSVVLDALPHISRTLGVPVNLKKFVTLGHSVGGSAALEQVLVERSRNSTKRILGAINMDGALLGTVSLNSSLVDLGVPSLLLGSTFNTPDAPTGWPGFEVQQSEWTKWVRIEGGKAPVNHTDFSDFVVWKQDAGIGGGEGVITASRMVEVTRRFVGDFLGLVMGRGKGVLSGSEEVKREWAEAVFVFNGTKMT